MATDGSAGAKKARGFPRRNQDYQCDSEPSIATVLCGGKSGEMSTLFFAVMVSPFIFTIAYSIGVMFGVFYDVDE